MRKPWRIAVLAVVATIAGGAVVTSASAGAAPPGPTDVSKIAVPQRLAQQEIDWEPCFNPDDPYPPHYKRLQCGFLTVPRNWRAPSDGHYVRIFVTRLPATSGTPKGVLFTNPGGPGGPGSGMPLALVDRGRTKVLESMDVVGIDVRGTGESTNLTCHKGYVGGLLDVRDHSPNNLDLLFTNTKVVMPKFCQRGATSELFNYVNTEQTVMDLDLLRSVLGFQQINWLGYSAGTWLGAHYSAYFPKRTGRFVLDSTVGLSSWQAATHNQPLGFQRRFEEDFAPWLAANEATFHFGRTGQEVVEKWEQLRADLKDLIAFGFHEFFTPMHLDFWTINSMYAKQEFARLGYLLVMTQDLVDHPQDQAARERLEARVTELGKRWPLDPLSMRRPMAPMKYDDQWGATAAAITCNDTPWVGDEAYVRDKASELGEKYPLAGWWTIRDSACNFWKRPALQLKKPTGAIVPPMLMVQSVHDPATPYEGALQAHDQLAGSRMITVTDEGDHGIYMSGNKCVDDLVEAYLVDDITPEEDLTCPGLPIAGPAAKSATESKNPLDVIAELSDRVAKTQR